MNKGNNISTSTFNKHTKIGLSYKEAGVDIDSGNQLVKKIKPIAKGTARPGATSELGGFGGLFDIKQCGYNDPILVAANDGVGTKILLAIEMNNSSTIGIDLVAMCVNDLVVQGAEPLFFLDYIATNKLNVDHAETLVKGIARGCQISNCALIGGETAEMPGLYKKTDFDLAGFAVGAVERDSILPKRVQEGDTLIALPSNGFHSNGYSLIRKVVSLSDASYLDTAPFDSSCSLGEALLTPTRIYVKDCLVLHRKGLANAFAHITGGGLLENIPRVLPPGLGVKLFHNGIYLPPMMEWLAKAGHIEAEEMTRTFNCGIGMVVFVSESNTDRALKMLQDNNKSPKIIGVVKKTNLKAFGV
ncbi:MAG: phosphoribosylformylglycinamidine cyclo-ligase [Rhodospirillaceae bacterium]|nr:phosphoribosylformylglycinamidine cyclo-ligase [Rhodospirillaceae bacterium]